MQKIIKQLDRTFKITEPSVASSSEVAVYASWAELLMRMTYCSVGKNPWTVVENKTHPAVAEPEFTLLDMPYLTRLSDEM